MAEPIGLAAGLLSLAALFSTCIDCFDFYNATQDCGEEFRTLLVQLDLEKTRLLVWAEHVGLMQVNSENRNVDLEKLEPSIRKALEEIKLLLAEANKVQERFGLQQRSGPEVSQGPSTDLVSKNSFVTYQANSRRFWTKFETVVPKPKLTLRIRWAIRDGAKFRGLINTLKDLTDSLFSLVSLGSDIQNETIEVDIMELIDLSDLHIVEEACEESSYPAWSAAASLAIDRTESGTIDRRTIAGMQAGVPQENDQAHLVNPAGSKLNEVDYRTDTATFFMITDSCDSFADSCAEKNFGVLEYTQSYEQYGYRSKQSVGRTLIRHVSFSKFTSQNLDDCLRQIREIEAKGGSIDPLASVIVYVAPCMRLIYTAYEVCNSMRTEKGSLLEFSIRIDDRLQSSCGKNSQGYERLKEFVNGCRRKAGDRNTLLKFLDLTWMEQRLYYLENDKDAPMTTRSVGHIFDDESNKIADEELAAILVVGEEEEIINIMNLLPLERDPRVPRVGQFFTIESSWNPIASRWMRSRKFLGKYTPNFNLDEKRISQIPSSLSKSSLVTSPAIGQLVTSTNSQTGSKKRKLSSQNSIESDDQ